MPIVRKIAKLNVEKESYLKFCIEFDLNLTELVVFTAFQPLLGNFMLKSF